jgi:hypothetical protein
MNMPGFNAEKSHYTSSVHYQNMSGLAGRANPAIDLAQLLRPGPGGGNGNGGGGGGGGGGPPPRCQPRQLGCGPDPESPGSCCVLSLTPSCLTVCGRACACPSPTVCSDKCLLPTSQLLAAIQSKQSIDLSTIRFQKTCTRGDGTTFTQDCVVPSPEGRIHIPLPGIPDRCFHITMGGLDASLINFVVREC